MAQEKSARDVKRFQALLNGVSKNVYFDDKSITVDYMKSEIYADTPEPEFSLLYEKAQSLLKTVASANMEMNQTEAFLTSQLKKKEGGISDIQAKAFSKFWKSNRSQLHEELVRRACFMPQLENLSWRVDLVSQQRSGKDVSASENLPTTIFELRIRDPLLEKESRVQNAEKTRLERFEMDAAQMDRLLRKLHSVRQKIEHFAEYSSGNVPNAST